MIPDLGEALFQDLIRTSSKVQPQMVLYSGEEIEQTPNSFSGVLTLSFPEHRGGLVEFALISKRKSKIVHSRDCIGMLVAKNAMPLFKRLVLHLCCLIELPLE